MNTREAIADIHLNHLNRCCDNEFECPDWDNRDCGLCVVDAILALKHPNGTPRLGMIAEIQPDIEILKKVHDFDITGNTKQWQDLGWRKMEGL